MCLEERDQSIVNKKAACQTTDRHLLFVGFHERLKEHGGLGKSRIEQKIDDSHHVVRTNEAFGYRFQSLGLRSFQSSVDQIPGHVRSFGKIEYVGQLLIVLRVEAWKENDMLVSNRSSSRTFDERSNYLAARLLLCWSLFSRKASISASPWPTSCVECWTISNGRHFDCLRSERVDTAICWRLGCALNSMTTG